MLSLMTCVKVGVQERANSHTALGDSQVEPQGSFKDFSGAHSEEPAQQAGAQEKPEPAGEVKERAESEIRPEMTLFKRNPQ